MPNPNPGEVLGAYTIEGSIGAGSMGDVFRAVDLGLNRRVAVKILSEKHRGSPELRARFVREGRAVAAISHPNVVQVFATGTHDERPYIAMELLDGADLGGLVERHGPMASRDAAAAVLDAARGLQAAAQAGLIHRDVKPSNLVRLADGRVKVTDFGLAKPVDPGSEPALTALGVVVGTPDYIAPEQARGEAIDERVDLYALGGTLYFLLTGRPPFRTGKPAEDKYLKVVSRHLRQPPPDARQANPAADPELAALAVQLMAKRAADRPDYRAVLDRLEAITARLAAQPGPAMAYPAPAPGEGGRTAPTPFVGGDVPGPGEAPAPDDPEGAHHAPAPAAARRRRLPGWLVVTAVLVGLVVLLLALVYATHSPEAPTAPPPSPAAATSLPDAGEGDVTSAPAPGAAPSPASGAAPSPAPGAVTSAPAPGAAPSPTPGAAAATVSPDRALDAEVLVRRPDGTPWLYVDAAPVRRAAYERVFPSTAGATAGDGAAPATDVAYNFAQAYAEALGRRLLRDDEYDAALATDGVRSPGPGLWEWVQPGPPARPRRPVRAPGARALRLQTGQPDVTFRLARDAAAPATP